MPVERRLILTGFAALVAAPALAQSSPPPPTDAPAAPAPAPSATPLAPAPAMKIAPPLTKSDASTAHIKDTLAAGSLSLLTSRIAAGRVGDHPMLKQFTGFEIAEQETIASILKAIMMPGGTPTGTVMAPTDAELTANLDAGGRAVVDRLRGTKAGADFDREYVKVQVEGHRRLLEIQEAYLKAPTDAEETAVAKLAKGMILEHLALLADLEKAMKG